MLPLLAVIVYVPGAVTVTIPFETDAPGRLLDHCTIVVTFWEAPLTVPVAVRLTRRRVEAPPAAMPRGMVVLGGSTVSAVRPLMGGGTLPPLPPPPVGAICLTPAQPTGRAQGCGQGKEEKKRTIS